MIGYLKSLIKSKREGDPVPCKNRIYRKGVEIGQAWNLDNWEIEKAVREAAKNSGQPIDWHYYGGIASIKSMGDLEKAADSLRESFQETGSKDYEVYTFVTSYEPTGILSRILLSHIPG